MKNLLLDIPTNINNTNNNNYNNYNNNTNDITTNNYNNSRWSSDQNGVVSNNNLTSSSLGSQEKENIVSQSEGLRKLPPSWKAAKWDLFHNGTLKNGFPNLKLKLWFVHKSSGKDFVYMAALNTPWSSGRMKYNVADDEWNNSRHWQTVKNHYKILNTMYDDVRSSKLAQTYKGSPTPVAVFCYRDQEQWFVDMVLDGTVYTYCLCDNLTEKQKLTKQIATVIIGNKQKPMLTLEEGGFV